MYQGAKDREPIDTIRINTEYLQSKKIFFIEEWHENNSGLYSVSVKIPGTGFSVNGKGINRELALASAHGEMQERLLNKAFFRINNDTLYWMSNSCEKSEIHVELLLKKIGVSESKIENLTKQITKSLGKTRALKDDVFISFSGDQIIVPTKVSDFLYGTNGMCAGNSYEEAFTQGLSEILERYVARKLFSGKVLTPDYNYKELAKAEYFDMLINKLENMGISVCVKDFSLGKEIPVLGVIFINQNNQTYFMKMGAHPNLNIALERCFTEFAQGRSNQQMSHMVHIEDVFTSEHDQLLRYFTDGNTSFPIELLKNHGKSTLKSTDASDNKGYFQQLKNLIEALNYTIYYQDNSSEAFQAFRIIIPGMSEIASPEDIPKARGMFDVNKHIKSLFESKSVSVKELNALAASLEKSNGLNKELGLHYPVISVKLNGRQLPKFKMFEFLNLMYLRKGEIEESYHFMINHIKLCKRDPVYLCLMMMEKLILDKKVLSQDVDSFGGYIGGVFKKNVRDAAINLLFHSADLFEVKWNVENNYFYQNRRSLYIKLYGYQ